MHCPTDIKDSNELTAADWARVKGYHSLVDCVERFQPGPRDPLPLYPTLEQLSRLECDRWLQLGVQLGLDNDQLESIKKSQHPTVETLRAAKFENIDMQWKDIVEALLDIKEGASALSVGAFYGWLYWVKYLVETVSLNPKEPVNKAGDTPLSLACANGHLDTIKYLVNEHRCDPRSTVNKAGDTPLSLACANGHLDTVKYLVNEHRCDPRSTVNKAGDTPLSLAYKNRHLETVKYLAQEHQCDTKFAVNEAGDTPLSLECSCGNLEMIKALINKHVDPNKPVNKAGDTPLSLAYKNRHLDTVKYLAQKHQCDTKFAVNDAEDTPLFLECSRGNLETIKALINKHVDLNKPINKAGDTPLSLACANGHLDTVIYLVNEQHCYPRSTVNKAGDTPLSLACANGHLDTVKYLVNEHRCDPRSTVNKAGDTPLSLAYKNRHLETVKYLAQEHQCDTKFAVNEAGDTPLFLECSRGNLDVIKALINKHVDPNKPVNKAGDTPLSLAYKNRHLETVKYLAQKHQCDTKFAVNDAEDTPLFLECSRGNLETIKALINKHVDLNKPINKAGDTPLSVLYKGGHWEVVKYLAITHHCDTKRVLLLAVKQGQKAYVKELLEECHSDPNVTDKERKSTLDLANDPEIIKLLLKHGAKTANVYKEHSKLIGELSSEQPLHLPLFVLLTGDGGVGKSTLLKSILSSKGFWAIFQEARPVDGVDARTVGIIPHEVYTKEFGRIIYFDFAGQKEFYTSHCAILENAVQTSPPIIILCAKLIESEQAIIDSMYRWLTLIQNQCANLKKKAHVIVVGSHADQVKEMGEDPRGKEGIFAPLIKQFPKFEFTEFIPMDCRFADSDDMKKARKQIQKSSAILRSPETISLNAHTFYIYLAESFKDDLAVSLGNVYEKIKSNLNATLSKRISDILSFIPSTLPHLVKICDQLHKSGLLLFLRNDSSPEKSFLVIDQVTLLSRVTGTVFAPESFRQHCKLASSTGVVPLLKFKKVFNGLNIEMLIAFMSHLELCFEVIDKQVLKYISKKIADQDASVPEFDTRYLFFPALIRIETPEQVWEEAQSIKYHFGWILETSQNTEFFDPRCFQVLILRIVFKFRLAPSMRVQHDIPSLQRFCSVWKSGICWCNDDGITAHLELAENGRSLALKMRTGTVQPENLILRSKIVSTIRETVESFGRNVNVIETVIDPDHVLKHPLKKPSELPLINVQDIAAAVCYNRRMIKSTRQVGLTFNHLLQFEPYAGLDQSTLQCIHSEKNAKKDEKISRAFISHFSNQVANPDSENPDQISRNSLMYIKILGHFRSSNIKIPSGSPRQEVVQALEMWRSETEGTYSCLRETLNTYSVFTGRNPLDLACVAHNEVDLSAFPDDTGKNLLQLDKVKNALIEICADWYSLAIQLDIDCKTRKVIERDHPLTEAGFHTMLQHWVRRPSPLPSWLALIRELKCPVINRADIAGDIEKHQGVSTNWESSISSQAHQYLFLQKCPLSVDQHLKVVREATWDARAKWQCLGEELGASIGKLHEIQHNHRDVAGACLTTMLEHWLIQTDPSPSWFALIEALRSPALDRGDIASEIETRITTKP
ncbi:uncharacterized protein LOC135345065 isoform X3 [Halichondria panicea]|uniref:uncharacterized protein LOC135345065 isoform X3 n=1 Tax=Halichondria panicea TaxID=6063 RepID=UPI00312B9DA7